MIPLGFSAQRLFRSQQLKTAFYVDYQIIKSHPGIFTRAKLYDSNRKKQHDYGSVKSLLKEDKTEDGHVRRALKKGKYMQRTKIKVQQLRLHRANLQKRDKMPRKMFLVWIGYNLLLPIRRKFLRFYCLQATYFLKKVMASEQAKDRGNKAFASGDYKYAISCFSEAIALYEKDALSGNAPPSSCKLYVYYSNRSACHLQLKDGDQALKDAEKCIALKSSWSKGYSRKGAALFQLGRYPEAYRTYQDGLKMDASNAALLEGLHMVEKNLRASQSTPKQATTTGAAKPPVSLSQLLFKGNQARFQLFQFVMRGLMLLNFILYWLPFLIPSILAYGNFFKIALLNYASYLAFAHGVPKFQLAYAQRLLMDPATQSVCFCLVFWMSSMYSLAMVPVVLIESIHYAAYMSSLLQTIGIANTAPIRLMTEKALIPLCAVILSDQTFVACPTQTKWSKLYHGMPRIAANMDVAIGIMLFIEIFTARRNFLLLILYWQLLRVRFMISPQLQEAFRSIDYAILHLTRHPRCPAVIGNLYTKIQFFAKKLTDPGQASSASSISRPRCSVM